MKIWNSLETSNCDGMDIISCTNVNVSDCDIRAGDDAIAIAGYAFHYELPGYYNLRHKSGNINISNCNLQSRSSGIRIGFEDQNSVSNINICNVNITNSNRGIGIFVRDSGSIENITISQVCIETHLHTGDWWGNGEPIHISAIRSKNGGTIGQIKNVLFRDINCKSENGIILYGTNESVIKNVRFENIRFELVNSELNRFAGGNIDLHACLDPRQQLFKHDIPGIYAQFIDGFSIRGFYLSWDSTITDKFFTYGLQIENFKNVTIENYNSTSAPPNKGLKTVFLSNGSMIKSDIDKNKIEIENVLK